MAALKTNQSGQTLVELVVALALMAMSITSAAALASVSSKTSGEAGRRSQAVALADREMEALRAYRDSELRDTATFLDGITGCANDQAHQWIMRPSVAGPGGWSKATVASPTAYSSGALDGTSLDINGNSVNFGQIYSSYSRMLTICDANGDSHTKNVQVQVNWTESNGTRQVIERTVLTDWTQS